MKKFLLLTACAFPLSVPAQDAKTGNQPMPDPKTPAHAALATLAGDWTTTCKMAGDKPSDSQMKEKAELLCNGLWLKWTAEGSHEGKQLQGVWLAGYDPFAKKYRSVFVSNDDAQPYAEMDGTYDEAKKTWTFTGDCGDGNKMRSVMAVKDANSMVETIYMIDPDGKEAEHMTMTRTRAKGAIPADALARASKEAGRGLPKEIALLAEDNGTWEATVTCTMPGQQPTTEKATETVTSICEGKWQWSDFKGTMMGQPFEGHALTGWDPKANQYVSYWISNGAATASKTTGKYDEAKKTFTFSGDCLCHEGKPMSIQQTYSRPDAITRNLHMTFKNAQGTNEMKIVYRKKA